jgi:CRISPR-associated helicase Cas3
LLPETEGTPLVGIAFRLEIEALREAPTDKDEDDPEEPAVSTEVIEIFKKLPPQRAELHQVPISSVREWLASPAGTEHPLLYRERDHWRVKQAGETGSAVIDSLTPDTTILLPASAAIKTSYKKLLEDCEDSDTALCDVFDGVSKDARYRREVKEKQGGRMQLRSREDGAYLWDERKEREAQRVSQIALNVEPGDEDNWRRCLRKELRISGGAYVFRYFKPRREHGGLQYLDDCEGKSGHISRAQTDASRLAAALVPGDEFLKSLLCAAALNHDEGKRHKKWQRAFGREEGQSELAKLRPDLERNAPLHGFRHEWESLRRLDKANEPPPQVIAPENHTLWRDLLLHLVAVHHGHLRPSLEDHGLNPDFAESLQNPLRLGATERFARLQRQIGPWRLAYLEALLKTADALASQEEEHDED